mgnify:CR=1 FL=1
MTRARENQYHPEVVSLPGETLEEVLAMQGLTQAELAERMGRPKKTVNEIIKGKAAITPPSPASSARDASWHRRTGSPSSWPA